MQTAQQNLLHSQGYAVAQAALHSISTHSVNLTIWLQEENNFAIWQRFAAEADAIWDTKRRFGVERPHWSARTIGEYIRHQTALHDSEGTFKVNDHMWPLLARLYLSIHPEREGFFELRKAA